jgi:hypothetical protein
MAPPIAGLTVSKVDMRLIRNTSVGISPLKRAYYIVIVDPFAVLRHDL